MSWLWLASCPAGMLSGIWNLCNPLFSRERNQSSAHGPTKIWSAGYTTSSRSIRRTSTFMDNNWWIYEGKSEDYLPVLLMRLSTRLIMNMAPTEEDSHQQSIRIYTDEFKITKPACRSSTHNVDLFRLMVHGQHLVVYWIQDRRLSARG